MNVTGLCYGQIDLPVTSDAVEAASAKVLAEIDTPIERCYSSPLQRCVELARTLCQDMRTDARLMEMDFGLWEGRRWEDLDRAELDYWSASHVYRRVPGGESWDDLYLRTTSFLAELRTDDSPCVGVVTHAGVMRAIVAEIMRMDLEWTWRIKIPFGSLITIELGATARGDRLLSTSP